MRKLLVLFFVCILSITAFAAEATEESATDSQPQSMSQTVDNLKTYLAENGIQLLLNLAAAAVIFIVGRWVARLVADLIKKMMDKAKVGNGIGWSLPIATAWQLPCVVMDRSRQDFFDHSSVDIGQPEIAAGVTVGQPRDLFAVRRQDLYRTAVIPSHRPLSEIEMVTAPVGHAASGVFTERPEVFVGQPWMERSPCRRSQP